MKYDIVKYQRIRDLREDRDLTQEAVANYLSVARNTYSQYETNTLDISLDVMAKLADFYDTSVDYLMGRTDEKKPYPRKRK